MHNRNRLSKLVAVGIVALSAGAVAAAGSKWPGTKVGEPAPKVTGTPAALAKNLANFDDLDFRVYSGQQWQNLHKSHAKDILVHYPDGHTTTGLDAHIQELKPMFTFAPDTKIKEHPVRFGTSDAEWTAVIGTMEGTFSRPMQLPNGKSIPATHKPFRLQMSTISRWNSEGVMTEEYLFWDNAAMMKQLGLSQ